MQCMCFWNVANSYPLIDQSLDWLKKEDRAISVIHTEDDIINYMRSFSEAFFAAAKVHGFFRFVRAIGHNIAVFYSG